jgi:quercetin dioxygenase-like cupin family protein
MKKLAFILTSSLLLCIASVAIANGQTPPPPTTLSTVNFTGVTPPAQPELIQEVIDFAPGAATPIQTRGGDLFVTVLEGQVALRRGASDSYYTANGPTNVRTFRVARGEVHSILNVNGTIKARIFASTLLPAGTKLTTDQPGTPPPLVAPAVAMTSKAIPTALPSQISVLQVVWEFRPGAATAPHTHHGFFLVTVVDGELGRLRLATGAEDIVRAGDFFIETPDISYDAIVRNSSPAPSLNVFTVLTGQVPPSTNVPAPGSSASSPGGAAITPPRTGDAGMVSGAD